jgi:hypothetical protein
MPILPRPLQISPRWRLGSRRAPGLQVVAWALLLVFAYGQAVHCCLDLKRWLGAVQQVQVVLSGLNSAPLHSAPDTKLNEKSHLGEMPACHRKPLASQSAWVSEDEGVGARQNLASVNAASLMDADTRCICLCPDESADLALASGPAFSTELSISVEFAALHQAHAPRQAPVAFDAYGQAPPGRAHGAPVYLLNLQILV